MSNTKNLKVTVPRIWKLKEVIGHDLLESRMGEETGLEQGLRNTVTTLHQYIICTSKVPAKPCATHPQIWEEQSLCAD